MANERVTLLRYAKIPGLGWRRGKAIIGKTGKVAPDYMLLGKWKDKRKVYAPEGHFVLRYFDGRLPRYKKLGNDPSEALDELQRAKSQLKFKNAAKSAGYIIPTPLRSSGSRLQNTVASSSNRSAALRLSSTRTQLSSTRLSSRNLSHFLAGRILKTSLNRMSSAIAMSWTSVTQTGCGHGGTLAYVVSSSIVDWSQSDSSLPLSTSASRATKKRKFAFTAVLS